MSVMKSEYDSHLDISRDRIFFLVLQTRRNKLAPNGEQDFCYSGCSRLCLVPMYLSLVSMNRQYGIESVTRWARPAF
jgi:hypothetical protein